MPTPLPRATPESQGIPSTAIAAFLARVQDLHSFMLLRHGSGGRRRLVASLPPRSRRTCSSRSARASPPAPSGWLWPKAG